MNPYGVNIDDKTIRGPVTSLKVLYERMPQTTGCERCKEINGQDREHWCCLSMNPSMYYVEFLYVWEQVQNHWSKKKKAALLTRVLVNYLDTSAWKGCVFYDKGCQAYNERPFNCRMYGVIPQKTWDKRIESLRESMGEEIKPYERQCNLVSTVNKKEITEEDEDNWFAFVRKAEKRIGMPPEIMKLHDIPGGSYRTFHDHIVLELLPAEVLNKLTKIKMSKPTREDLHSFAQTLLDQLSESGLIECLPDRMSSNA